MIWNPGRLLRLAWDSTKLAGDIIAKRKETALVLAEENAKAVRQYKGKEANKQLQQLFDEKKYEELSRLYLPNFVVDKGIDLVNVWWKIWDVYWLFCILRILLVFLPQPGYIHPDEYFQTVEVVVGDVFNVEVVRSWEFNSTSALKSMTMNAVVFGGPLYILKFMDFITTTYLGFSVVSSYLVCLIPRITMLSLSFVVDWCVYQICILYKHNFNQCLTTLSSSVVMLVFASRSLVDNLEMVLASLLMYLVAHCMKRTSETVYLQSLVQDSYDKAKNVREKVDIHKRKKLIPPHDFKHVISISIVVCVGVFNRPTFIISAMIPLFYWFQRGVANHSYFTPFQMFNFRMVAMIPGFLITGLILILTDSLYYGEVTFRKMWDLELEWSDWKCCPVQYVMKNYVPGNLGKIGSFPLYFHSLINLPLLFGPLGLIAIFSVMEFFGEIIQNEWRRKPGVRNVYALTLFTFIVGIIAGSLSPEPDLRLLLPLTLPTILMNSHKLRSFKLKRTGWMKRPLLAVWYLFNLSGLIFYGYIHQAGVGSMMRDLKEVTLAKMPKSGSINVILSNTFMPAKHPLLIKSNKREFPIEFIDMGAKSVEDDLKQKIIEIALETRMNRTSREVRNFVAVPTILSKALTVSLEGLVLFRTEMYKFPHMSLESFADPSVIESINGYYMKYTDTNHYGEILHDITKYGIGRFVCDGIAAFLNAVRTIGGLSLLQFELTKDEAKVIELKKNFLQSKSKILRDKKTKKST